MVDLIPWSGVGLGGLVTIALVMILTGRLVPKSIVDELRKERDARLSDMQEAYSTSEEARRVVSRQLTEVLENSRTTVRVMEALREAANPSSPSCPEDNKPEDKTTGAT